MGRMPQPKDNDWLNRYKQDPYIFCLQETHLKPRDTYRLKVRSWRKIFHANGDQRKAGVAILTSDKIDFSICWRAGLVVLNSLSFCLSVKLLISPSYLNEVLAGYSNLGCRLLSFITLSMSCHSFLA